MADLSLGRHILQEIVKKAVRPRQRRSLVQWIQQAYGLSERRAADGDVADDAALAVASRPAGGIAGTGGEPGSLRLPALDRAVEAGRLAGECQTCLPATARKD